MLERAERDGVQGGHASEKRADDLSRMDAELCQRVRETIGQQRELTVRELDAQSLAAQPAQRHLLATELEHLAVGSLEADVQAARGRQGQRSERSVERELTACGRIVSQVWLGIEHGATAAAVLPGLRRVAIRRWERRRGVGIAHHGWPRRQVLAQVVGTRTRHLEPQPERRIGRAPCIEAVARDQRDCVAFLVDHSGHLFDSDQRARARVRARSCARRPFDRWPTASRDQQQRAVQAKAAAAGLAHPQEEGPGSVPRLVVVPHRLVHSSPSDPGLLPLLRKRHAACLRPSPRRMARDSRSNGVQPLHRRRPRRSSCVARSSSERWTDSSSLFGSRLARARASRSFTRGYAPMRSRPSFRVLIALLALGVLFGLQALFADDEVAEIPYSQFHTLLEQKQVTHVVISSDEIRGTLVAPLKGKTQFSTRQVDPRLAAELDRNKVSYSRSKDSAVPAIVSVLLPLLLLFGLISLTGRRMAAGPGSELLSIGKSKAKVYLEKKTGVTFADVAGVDEAKAELEEIVAFLKNPEQLRPARRAHAERRAARGAARHRQDAARARGRGRSRRALLLDQRVGVRGDVRRRRRGARARPVRAGARRRRPRIIFIDELDALGRARGAGVRWSAARREGADAEPAARRARRVRPRRAASCSLAATNRPEILDPGAAARRPLRSAGAGRPARQEGPRRHPARPRAKVEARARASMLEQVAALTPGFTGADLANLVNEAALVATRRGASCGDDGGLHRRRSSGSSPAWRSATGCSIRSEREIVAYHEMGHALVALALPGSDPVHKVSIIPRGIGALGYTIQRPTEDRYLMTRAELENKMAVLLGGRAAEHLVFGHVSTGAADDLVKATKHRAQHGHALRHGRGARPSELRATGAELARAGHVRAEAELQRARPPAQSTTLRDADRHRRATATSTTAGRGFARSCRARPSASTPTTSAQTSSAIHSAARATTSRAAAIG